MKNQFITIAGFCIIILSLLSCQKENSVANDGDNGTQQLLIKIAGIDDPISKISATNNLNKTASSSVNQAQTSTSEIKQIDGINVETSFLTDKYGDETNAESSNINKSAATTIINQSTRYRFILFKKNANNSYTYVGYQDATRQSSYTATAFTVLKGSTYKWVAYSYNTADNITDQINENTFSIETSVNKDLLYASEELFITNNRPGLSEDFKINILFKHRLARVAITLKANDFPAVIKQSNLSAKLAASSQNYFSKGRLNLLNNELSNVEKVKFDASLSFFNAPLADGGDSTKIAYLYTSDFQTPMPNINILVNNITFEDIYSYRDGNYPSVRNKEITINTRNQVAQQGVSYRSAINFSNNDGIIKGNIIWARGNLTYIPSNNTFRINKTPNGYNVNAQNDYWMYNSLTPWDQTITNDASHRVAVWQTSTDPCRKVAGGWRLPTQAEVLALGGRDTPPQNRLQAPNWDNRSPVTWGSPRPNVNIPQNSYTSFKGDDGQWATFFKTAIMNTSYNRDVSRWALTLDDSALIAVSDGNASGGSYNFMQIDGEQNYFKFNNRALDRKIGVRCVKNRF